VDLYSKVQVPNWKERQIKGVFSSTIVFPNEVPRQPLEINAGGERSKSPAFIEKSRRGGM